MYRLEMWITASRFLPPLPISVDYGVAIPAAASNIVGNLVGVNFAIKKGEKIIKPVMLVVVILTVIKFAWDNNLWG